MFKPILTSSILLSFGLASLSAQEAQPPAQASPAPEGEASAATASSSEGIQLSDTVTVIGSAAAVQDMVGSAAFFDSETFRTHNYINPNRALARVPGVYFREEDGFGNFPNISLRGVDSARSGKVTLMEDGVLMAPAPYSAPSAYYSPRMGRMSGIEILKGSSQFEYGPQTTGGVVNYLATPIPTEQEGYARFTYGSNNSVFGHIWYGDSIQTESGTFGFLFELHGQYNEGFRDFIPTRGGEGGGTSGYQLLEPMIRLSWEPNTNRYQRWELKLGYSDFVADETYLGLSEEDYADNPYRRYAATRFDEFDAEQYRLSLNYEIELTDWLDFSTTAYYNHFHRDWFKLGSIRVPGEDSSTSLSKAVVSHADILRGDAAGTLNYTHNDRTYYSTGIQNRFDARFSTGDFDHELALGFRYHYDQVRRDQYNRFYEQDDFGRIIANSRNSAGSAGDRRQEATAIALYLIDEISWGDFTLTPGIRYEYVDYEFEDFNSGESGSRSLDVFAPGIGFTWQPTEQLTFFGGAYRGFSLPSPRNYIRGDQEEETSDSFELGLRYQNEEQAFAFELAGFYTNFENLIVLDNIGGTGSTGNNANVGSVDSYGLEFAVNWDPASAAGADIKTPMYFTATLTEATLDGDANSADPESIFSGGRDGNRVPYIPEYQFAAGIGLEWDQWAVNLDATYTPATFTTASNVSRPSNDARFGKTTDAFTVDLSMSYQFTEGLKLVAGVNNLFDDESLTSRLPHGPRSNAPRTYFVGAEYRF